MKSLLYTPDMLQATIAGRKTQTRRVEKKLDYINENPDNFIFCRSLLNKDGVESYAFDNLKKPDFNIAAKPKYQVGDVCYLREGFRLPENLDHLRPSQIEVCPVEFKSGGTINCIGDSITKTQKKTQKIGAGKWRSPYHLPAHLARYFVKITNVKVERLQDISGFDCVQEGLEYYFDETTGYHNRDYTIKDWKNHPVDIFKSFESLWISLYGEDAWRQNPWLFVYTQQLCDRDGKEVFHG